MKTFTIRIPTTKYLRKYLVQHFGHPVPLNNHNIIGVMVISLLHKKSVTYMNLAKKDTRFQKLNDHFVGVGPFKLRYQAGGSLDDDAIIQINRVLEDAFECELFHFVRFQVINKIDGRYPGYDEALEKFAERYGIEIDEDISFDGLKKMEYRFRKKHEERLPSFVPPGRYVSRQGNMFEGN